MAGGQQRSWNFLTTEGDVYTPGTTEEITADDAERLKGIRFNGYDPITRRYAMLALGNIAANEETHDDLYAQQETFFQSIKGSLAANDPETRFNAAYTMGKLTGEHPERVIDADIIKSLTNLVGDEDEDTECQAVAAIRR